MRGAGGVWFRFGAELRCRWRAWLALAVLLGITATGVLVLAAGARRTASAYERFLDEQAAYDVMVVNYRGSFFDPDLTNSTFDLATLRSIPAVEDTAASRYFFAYIGAGVGVLAPSDARMGSQLNRHKILAGRRADPEEPAEVVVGFTFAEEQHIEVGDRITLFDPRLFGDPPPERRADAEAASRRILAGLPDGRATVVGIEASPGEFPPQIVGPDRYLIHATPAFHHLADDVAGFSSGGEAVMVRLRGGEADVDGFLAELQRRGGGQPPDVVLQRDRTAAVGRSIYVQAMALWLLALLMAAAGAAIAGQLLARMTTLESLEHPTLAAIGMTRWQLLGLGLLRGAVIGTAAAVMATVLAVPASPLFPLGLAATAEPTPGVLVEVPVLVLGGLAIALAVVALTAWPAWRAACAPAVGGPVRPPAPRRSLLAGPSLEPGLRVPMGVGLRMAFERGRGPSNVPVLSGITGVTLGVTMLVAALVFGANLEHLLATPRLYGQTWDATLTTYDDDIVTQGSPVLASDSRVAAVAIGTPWLQVTIDGQRVDGLALDAVDGAIGPTILDGRAPRGNDEIAVGSRTLRSLGLDIGDTVDVGLFATDRPTGPARIVGRAVFPLFSETGRLGDGVAMTLAGAEKLTGEPPEVLRNVVFIRVGDDDPATLDAIVEDLRPHILTPAGLEIAVNRQGKPTDIVNFGRVEATPYVLAGLSAVLATSTLTYLVATSTHRRRRDHATLKALGLLRREIRATVHWQAIAVTVVALLVSLPLGTALGRWAWAIFANGLGVVVERTTPWTELAILCPAALLVAVVVSAAPAATAARLDAAALLHEDARHR